ncbi:hypothetical protein [Pedobacter sp. JCM 36344]|uniref:hypothetical protein n=1 Tax=Pedobacter sp. JCM 36344 TaxID=3374280 RepID=UPI00397E44AA
MSNKESNSLGGAHIPEQKVGSEINASSTATSATTKEAISHYDVVKKRLLDVNNWFEFANLPVSSFKLFDHSCRVAERSAIEGDYIRIDIPGPGTKTVQGYYWVVVEAILEESSNYASVLTMRVRPSAHPLSDDQHTAHFLTDLASSTFQIKRSEAIVIAEQHGRNEIPNRDTPHTFDNLGNTVVGWSSKIGFSYPQWKGLVKGLVKP